MTSKIKATDPPKTKGRYAQPLAWTLAGLMIVMAVVHLIRIDKLIPVVSEVVSFSSGATSVLVTLIVISEVLAVPFLLRMRLSPLARFLSGLLIVVPPLIWTCITIWAAGNTHSTGELSSYVSTPSSWWLIVLNLIWLSVSYWALVLLGFDKAYAALRKRH